jgi:hypothetical protein
VGVIDEGPEQLGGGVPRVALKDILEGGGAQAALAERVVDQAGQLLLAQPGREIEDGTGAGGGGHAALAGDVTGL